MKLQDLRKRFEPVLRRGLHLYWRVARGMTLGVRAIVLDGDDRVFLVKHSYVAGCSSTATYPAATTSRST
jgi:hypothetical protein